MRAPELTYLSIAHSPLGHFPARGKTRGRAREAALRRYLRAAKHQRGESWPACFYEYILRADGVWDLLGSTPGDPKWRDCGN
jgi:hypothetical protein